MQLNQVELILALVTFFPFFLGGGGKQNPGEMLIGLLPAFANIGYQTYIIFAVINAFMVPCVYFFYPETAYRSLEEVFMPALETDYISTMLADQLITVDGRDLPGMPWLPGSFRRCQDCKGEAAAL